LPVGPLDAMTAFDEYSRTPQRASYPQAVSLLVELPTDF
jgi:hypothetical protein